MKKNIQKANTAIPSAPIMIYSPVVIKVPGREVDLQVKVSMPATGNNLPIILLSHGHGQSNFLSSLKGYGPLADFYAAQGFVVFQPTHQDSKILGLQQDGPEGALFWKSRAHDMHVILDHLDLFEETVPGLKGRLDKKQVTAVGHSMGGHTVCMLSGMKVEDPVSGDIIDLREPRLKAGIIFGAPGKGSDIADFGKEHYPVLFKTNFTGMDNPVLVVNGDKDVNLNFSDRADWRADAYYLSDKNTCLLTIKGSLHTFGGISGYDAGETQEENPDMVAMIQQITLAYLRTALNPEDKSWESIKKELEESDDPKASIECK
ncbi:hypothetical protein N0B16_12820 [Chryseobacterium sp. GMJ5]|uniref:Chlorophyllase n=1 Tax=Chryseobacterium gilvum TaxID=2976534 RepID=A0ABT2VZB5_9FLAO|nr:hypothetical protein [Chryseobacterium gilvum]MCU7615322.1 hypothetical protein [Chryseobacterium gilvum]